jgi:hypothetical protein
MECLTVPFGILTVGGKVAITKNKKKGSMVDATLRIAVGDIWK